MQECQTGDILFLQLVSKHNLKQKIVFSISYAIVNFQGLCIKWEAVSIQYSSLTFSSTLQILLSILSEQSAPKCALVVPLHKLVFFCMSNYIEGKFPIPKRLWNLQNLFLIQIS
jgi:hypothetical protein